MGEIKSDEKLKCVIFLDKINIIDPVTKISKIRNQLTVQSIKFVGIKLKVKMLRKKFLEFGPVSTPRHEFNKPGFQIKNFAPPESVCKYSFN